MGEKFIIHIKYLGSVREYPLDSPKITIGRSSDNDIAIDDQMISRHHAQIELLDGVPHVTDLNSSNGTRINSEAIEPEKKYPVKDGDSIFIGNAVLLLQAHIAPVAEQEKASSKVTIVSPKEESVSLKGKTVEGLKRWKIPAIVCAVVIVFGIGTALFITLGSASSDDVGTRLLDYLSTVKRGTMEQLDTDIEKIDGEIALLAEKKQKFNQVVTPAIQWVEIQKGEVTDMETGSWTTTIEPEGLKKLKNDTYEVVSVAFTARQVNTAEEELTYEIKVKDLNNNIANDWEVVNDNVTEQINKRIDMRKSKVDQRADLNTVFLDMSSHWQGWSVQGHDKDVVAISGYGLGYQGTVTDGIWYYNEETGEAIPGDSNAEGLEQLFAGR